MSDADHCSLGDSRVAIQHLLDLTDGSRTLYELCEAGPLNPGINARILYAMLAIELIGREHTSKAVRIQVRDR